MERLAAGAALLPPPPPPWSSSLEQLLLRQSMGESVGPVALEGADVSSSLGELNRGQSLKGVLLKLKVV